jgi:hypothetical protein
MPRWNNTLCCRKLKTQNTKSESKEEDWYCEVEKQEVIIGFEAYSGPDADKFGQLFQSNFRQVMDQNVPETKLQANKIHRILDR